MTFGVSKGVIKLTVLRLAGMNPPHQSTIGARRTFPSSSGFSCVQGRGAHQPEQTVVATISSCGDLWQRDRQAGSSHWEGLSRIGGEGRVAAVAEKGSAQWWDRAVAG
jgi:hypothetical protein